MNEGLVFDIHRGTTHDGPGMRTTVFLKGCPLHCTWCQNPESIYPGRELMWDAKKCIGCMECIKACPVKALTADDSGIKTDKSACRKCFACAAGCPSKAMQIVGNPWEVSTLVKEACKDRMFFEDFSGGVTVSGGEPLLQSEFLPEFLRTLKKEGINTALDTSGFGRQEVLHEVYPFVDTFLYDIKFINDGMHQAHTGVSNKIILENLKSIADRIRRQKDSRLWIRTPLIPGATAAEENIEEIGQYIRKELIDVIERWELCAFNYVCKDKYIKMGQYWKYAECTLLDCSTVEDLASIAEKYAEGIVVVSGLTAQKK